MRYLRFSRTLVAGATVVLLSMSSGFAQAQTPAAAPPAAAPAMPAAAPAAAPAPHVPSGRSLISVNDCNPKLNVQQYGGGYVGYAPVAWGGGFWGDPYGARFYQPPVTTTSPQLAIHYKNISPKTMTTIDFGLVANGVLVAEVRDVGTFTPHAEIKHRFALNPNVFPLRTGLPQCVPLHIVFSDGSKWRNPALPPPNQKIYYNP
jgi:hypothetical protein